MHHSHFPRVSSCNCKRVGCLDTPTVNNTKSYTLQLSAEGIIIHI